MYGIGSFEGIGTMVLWSLGLYLVLLVIFSVIRKAKEDVAAERAAKEQEEAQKKYEEDMKTWVASQLPKEEEESEEPTPTLFGPDGKPLK